MNDNIQMLGMRCYDWATGVSTSMENEFSQEED